MPILIKESEHFPISENNPEPIPYAVAAITIYERKKKIQIDMIDKDAFDAFYKKIKRMYFSIAREGNYDKILFKTTQDSKNYSFYFRRNNDEALRFLRCSKVISEITYEEALKTIKRLGVSNNEIQKSDLDQNSQSINEGDESNEHPFEEKKQADQNSIESNKSPTSPKSSVVIPSSFFPNRQINKKSADSSAKKTFMITPTSP